MEYKRNIKQLEGALLKKHVKHLEPERNNKSIIIKTKSDNSINNKSFFYFKRQNPATRCIKLLLSLKEENLFKDLIFYFFLSE